MTAVIEPELLDYATAEEREELERVTAMAEALDALEERWDDWLGVLFPVYCGHPFAAFHERLWEWVWSIEQGRRPRPLVEIVFRGGAKSTSAELACVALGARRVRRYGLYVCETQDQADDHVQNIAGMLESPGVDEWYPWLGKRLVGKYGNSRGWRVNRLRTASGFTIDAVGLDTAARGVKLDEQRPDFMIIDDVDSEGDTPATTEKKIRTLTHGLLPAGATDLAVLAIQNLVHADSIFARIADGRADFLADRILVGPVPALEDVEWTTDEETGRIVLTRGTPTWSAITLERCQEVIDDIGLSAWLGEAQHETEAPSGGMFDHLQYRRCDEGELPDLVRSTVWVDPAVTATDKSDSCGVQADGLGADGKIYRLFSWEQRATPVQAMTVAITVALELGATTVGVETDQGGDTWESVYREALARVREDRTDLEDVADPRFRSQKAGAGHGSKVERAAKMLAAYENGWFVHVRGSHTTLERALRRFPKSKPFDLTDAAFWSALELRPEMGRKARRRIVVRHQEAA